jgi:hypothetical protein
MNPRSAVRLPWAMHPLPTLLLGLDLSLGPTLRLQSGGPQEFGLGPSLSASMHRGEAVSIGLSAEGTWCSPALLRPPGQVFAEAEGPLWGSALRPELRLSGERLGLQAGPGLSAGGGPAWRSWWGPALGGALTWALPGPAGAPWSARLRSDALLAYSPAAELWSFRAAAGLGLSWP